MVQLIGVSTVMSPLPAPLALAVVMVTLVPAVSAVTISATFTLDELALGSGVKTLPVKVPPLVAVFVMLTSAGSSSHWPASPLVAEALIWIPATSSA